MKKLNFPRLIMRYVSHLLSSTFLPKFYTGWACPCRPLYGWSNAFTQGHMHSPWSCSGSSESHCLSSSVPGPIIIFFAKTSQLPEDDRYSVSYKQYLATIDVSMGGRVAEELSKSFFAHSLVFPLMVSAISLRNRKCLKWGEFRY